MFVRFLSYSGLLILSALMMINCTGVPKGQPEAEPEVKPVPPPTPPKFTVKSYHLSMKEEMLNSYERADEIIIGVFTGSYKDKKYGLSYYFEDYSTFNKETLSWGPKSDVIVQILPHQLKPEIITRKEYKNLSDLDEKGICWDDEDQIRYIYLVEAVQMLIFVELEYDEKNNRSNRNLIDAYPVTKTCSAREVFHLMLRERKPVIRSALCHHEERSDVVISEIATSLQSSQ
jgi:hypothetical protein